MTTLTLLPIRQPRVPVPKPKPAALPLTRRGLAAWPRWRTARGEMERRTIVGLAGMHPDEEAALVQFRINLETLGPPIVGEKGKGWFTFTSSGSAHGKLRPEVLDTLLKGLDLHENAVADLVRACEVRDWRAQWLEEAVRARLAPAWKAHRAELDARLEAERLRRERHEALQRQMLVTELVAILARVATVLEEERMTVAVSPTSTGPKWKCSVSTFELFAREVTKLGIDPDGTVSWADKERLAASANYSATMATNFLTDWRAGRRPADWVPVAQDEPTAEAAPDTSASWQCTSEIASPLQVTIVEEASVAPATPPVEETPVISTFAQAVIVPMPEGPDLRPDISDEARVELQLRSDLDDARETIGELRVELDEAQETITSLRARLNQENGRVEHLKSDLELAREAAQCLDQVRTKLANALRQRDEARMALDQVKQLAEIVTKEREKARMGLQTALAEIQCLRAEVVAANTNGGHLPVPRAEPCASVAALDTRPDLRREMEDGQREAALLVAAGVELAEWSRMSIRERRDILSLAADITAYALDGRR